MDNGSIVCETRLKCISLAYKPDDSPLANIERAEVLLNWVTTLAKPETEPIKTAEPKRK